MLLSSNGGYPSFLQYDNDIVIVLHSSGTRLASLAACAYMPAREQDTPVSTQRVNTNVLKSAWGPA